MSKTVEELKNEISDLRNALDRLDNLRDSFSSKLENAEKELKEAMEKEIDPFSLASECDTGFIYWLDKTGGLNVYSTSFFSLGLSPDNVDNSKYYNEIKAWKKSLGLVWFDINEAKEDMTAIKYRMILRYFKRKYDKDDGSNTRYYILECSHPATKYSVLAINRRAYVCALNDLDRYPYSICFYSAEAANKCVEYLNSHDLQVV